MKEHKELLKNVSLLMVSNFGSKILAFFLIPLYTSILSTEDYGIYDICVNTASLLMPILSVNIVEAVLRFSIDMKKSRDTIFKIGFKYVSGATILFAAVIAVDHAFRFVSFIDNYGIYIILYFWGLLLYDFLFGMRVD